MGVPFISKFHVFFQSLERYIMLNTGKSLAAMIDFGLSYGSRRGPYNVSKPWTSSWILVDPLKSGPTTRPPASGAFNVRFDTSGRSCTFSGCQISLLHSCTPLTRWNQLAWSIAQCLSSHKVLVTIFDQSTNINTYISKRSDLCWRHALSWCFVFLNKWARLSSFWNLSSPIALAKSASKLLILQTPRGVKSWEGRIELPLNICCSLMLIIYLTALL